MLYYSKFLFDHRAQWVTTTSRTPLFSIYWIYLNTYITWLLNASKWEMLPSLLKKVWLGHSLWGGGEVHYVLNIISDNMHFSSPNPPCFPGIKTEGSRILQLIILKTKPSTHLCKFAYRLCYKKFLNQLKPIQKEI